MQDVKSPANDAHSAASCALAKAMLMIRVDTMKIFIPNTSGMLCSACSDQARKKSFYSLAVVGLAHIACHLQNLYHLCII